MNKILYIIRNVIFIINIILIAICTELGLPQVMNFNVQLIYPMIIIMFTICLIDLIKNKKHANHDSKYNYIFIISNVIIMLIILRGIFDKSIVTNTMDEEFGYKMLFTANNLIYFNIIYLCLIIYRFTIKKQKIAK